MTFAEIKTNLNSRTIPQTLDGEFMYYTNVSDTISIYINHIEGCIQKGYDPRKCKECKRSKRLLLLIVEQLDDETKHNAPRPIPKYFYNKY